jgi:hypothetical protein
MSTHEIDALIANFGETAFAEDKTITLLTASAMSPDCTSAQRVLFKILLDQARIRLRAQLHAIDALRGMTISQDAHD